MIAIALASLLLGADLTPAQRQVVDSIARGEQLKTIDLYLNEVDKGTVGRLVCSLNVRQVVDRRTLLLHAEEGGLNQRDKLLMLKGLDTSPYTDGRMYPFGVIISSVGNETYQTAFGSKTVPLAEAIDLSALESAVKEAIEKESSSAKKKKISDAWAKAKQPFGKGRIK